MRYNTLVLDIDGTLLDSHGKISEYTKEMLKLIKDDVKIILASARGYYSIRPILLDLDLISDDQYVISFNGAHVSTTDDKKIFFDQVLDKDIILKTIEYLKDQAVATYIYDENGRYSIKDIDETYLNRKIYKIVSEGDKDLINEIKNDMPDDLKDNLEITSSFLNRFEAIAKGISKVSALKLLEENKIIDLDKTIAVGDADNDVDMIMHSGLGVAMGNAQDVTLRCADLITYDNDHDGVGHLIDMMFY